MKTIKASNNSALNDDVKNKPVQLHGKKYAKLNAYLSRISKNLSLSYVAMMK